MAHLLSTETLAADDLDDLYRRPGFLIRRAKQIAVWLFLEEAALPITTTQFGAMFVLRNLGDMDQIGLAKTLTMDKSTTALVVGKLEAAGYLVRGVDVSDKRRNMLRLTKAGVQTLDSLAGAAERSRQRLLSIFNEREARTLLRLLEHYVDAHSAEPATPAETGPIRRRGGKA